MKTIGAWLSLWLCTAAVALAQSASLVSSSPTYASGGGTITLTATINYSNAPSSLGFALTLPAGWSYASGTSEPAVKPTSGQTGTLEWAYLDGFGANSVSFTVTLNYPAGLSGAQAFSAEAYYSSPFATLNVASVVLTGVAAPVPLAFTGHPGNQIVGAGESATFTATIDGSPAPAFQWQLSTDGGNNWSDVAGASSATLTLSNVSLAQTGSLYRLRATRDSTTVYSNSASLTVNALAPAVRWSASSSQLSASGGTLTFSVTFDYPVLPTALGFEATLPAGWSYQGGTSEPAVKPAVGSTGTVEWAYLDGFGGASSTFTFSVQYPAGQTGSEILSARGYYYSPASTLTPPDLTFTATGARFSEWRIQSFTGDELLLSNISSPTADPDTDGLANLMEYALGSEPKLAGALSLPQPSFTTADWTYTYSRPADRADLSYSVEASTNLTLWTTTGVTHERISTGPVETWRASFSRAAAPQIFFRLKVSMLQ